MEISVIVTIHNAEKYIRECIESVLRQTFSDIEVLCMDGGSTDGTPQILAEYAKKDKRVHIVNDSNTSYGHKVNRGIVEAQGRYVSVLESDDMYEPYMLEILYKAITRYNVDFVNGSYTEFYDVNGCRIMHTIKMYKDCDYNRIINNMRQTECFENVSRYWTGLFKKEFLINEKIKMNESPGASYQDMSFRFLTSALSCATYHIESPVYLYRIDNPGSSVHDSTKAVEIVEEHKFLKNELLKRKIVNPYIWHMAYEWKYADFRANMRHLRNAYRQELFGRYLDELEKDKNMLEQYKGDGYSQAVSDMIYGTPVQMAELIEADVKWEEERQKNRAIFWDRILVMDRNRRVVVFGCGMRGSMVLEEISFLDFKIYCLVDNDRKLWNTEQYGYTVLSPAEAVEKYPDALYIVANKCHSGEIAQQLCDMGIHRDMVLLY